MSLIAEKNRILRRSLRIRTQPRARLTWGTCAEKLVKTLNLLKVKVKRNAFGRQAQSSTRICDFSNFIPHCNDFPATFIRAPVIEEVLDPEHVQVLYKLDGKDNGGQELIVAAKQKNNILATSFHPELAENDIRFHDWFIREFVLKNYSK
ncbi:CBM_HP2_G0036390.mRNA.1.CDS.1 [Saccharomyces cerevisiae]|nr:CBM_HP2_G0036390.mRNA.1.CDS.1 [Saccharomyces cerevisiae]CAI6596312.1 CBM_HP2_G0036390.mRNA.1.CDS.1 [Saccharomyces cerevisiae]